MKLTGISKVLRMPTNPPSQWMFIILRTEIPFTELNSCGLEKPKISGSQLLEETTALESLQLC